MSHKVTIGSLYFEKDTAKPNVGPALAGSAPVIRLSPLVSLPVEIDAKDRETPLAKREAWKKAIVKLTEAKGAASVVEIDHRFHCNDKEFVIQFCELLLSLFSHIEFKDTKVTWNFRIVFTFFDMGHISVVSSLRDEIRKRMGDKQDMLQWMSFEICELLK